MYPSLTKYSPGGVDLVVKGQLLATLYTRNRFAPMMKSITVEKITAIYSRVNSCE